MEALTMDGKTGRWTKDDDYGDCDIWYCSVCDMPMVFFSGGPKENQFRFCPRCGAKMEEVQNDE